MIYQPRIEQSDWSEVTSHGTKLIIRASFVSAHCVIIDTKLMRWHERNKFDLM